MSTFEDRGDSLENKFAYEEEQRFKAIVKRNRMLGLWAASILGKEGQDADAYAAEVVKSDFEESGDDDVVRKVSADLASAEIGEDEIRAKMDFFYKEALDSKAD